MSVSNLGLSEVVERLKSEIRKGSESGDPMFRVKSAKVTLKILVEQTSRQSGGVKIFVFEGAMSGDSSQQAAHEIVLELDPIDDEILGA